MEPAWSVPAWRLLVRAFLVGPGSARPSGHVCPFLWEDPLLALVFPCITAQQPIPSPTVWLRWWRSGPKPGSATRERPCCTVGASAAHVDPAVAGSTASAVSDSCQVALHWHSMPATEGRGQSYVDAFLPTYLAPYLTSTCPRPKRFSQQCMSELIKRAWLSSTNTEG